MERQNFLQKFSDDDIVLRTGETKEDFLYRMYLEYRAFILELQKVLVEA